MALRVRFLAVARVVEDNHAALAGIDALHPTIERLMEIVEVVLGIAITLGGRTGSIIISHALSPAVVHANGLGEAVTNTIEGATKVACTGADVVPGIPAAIGGIAVGTLVGGDLH